MNSIAHPKTTPTCTLKIVLYGSGQEQLDLAEGLNVKVEIGAPHEETIFTGSRSDLEIIVGRIGETVFALEIMEVAERPKYYAHYFGGRNPETNWIVVGPDGMCSQTTSKAGAEAQAARMNSEAA